MTSSIKIILPLIPYRIILLLAAIHYSSSNPEQKYIDNIESFDGQVSRHSRAVQPTVQYCKLNHFYDEEKRRCLSVPGGGRILHVEKERSCGINILKSHCSSSLYYHICTRGRSILAQCGSGQIFNSRLQRCITSRQTQPDKHYDPNSVPDCTKPGRFSVPGHCSVFYTCNTQGRQLYRSVYKCPRNTGYYADKGTCAVMPDCKNDDSVDYAVCVPDSSDENLESRNSDEAAGKDIAGTPAEEEAIEESKVEEKRNASPKTDDYAISTTPGTVMDNPRSVNNKENNDNGMENTSTQPIEDASVPESTESLYKSYTSTNETDESSVSPESTISSSDSLDETNSERSPRIVNDEQENIMSHEVSSDVSTDSSQLYTTDSSFVSQTDDASQSDFTTEAIAHDSVSPAGEDQAYDSTPSLETSEITQSPIEDVSVPGDVDETSTVETSDPTETTQEAPEKDQLPIWVTSPSPTELDNDASHSVMSAISTTEYSTNADVDSNFDTATTDTSLFSSVSYTSPDSSPELDEETHVATTAQYENDDTSSAIPLNSSTETVDQDSTSSNDTSATMSDLNSDDSHHTSSFTTASDTIFSPGPIANAEQYTTESVFTFGTSASPDSEDNTR